MNASSAMPLEIADLAFRLSEDTLSTTEAQPLYDWVAQSTENRTAFSELLMLFAHLEWERCASKLVPPVDKYLANSMVESLADPSQRNCSPTASTCTAAAAAPSRRFGRWLTGLHRRKSLRVKAALTLGIGAIYYGFWILLFWGISGNDLANDGHTPDSSLELIRWHETVAQFHHANRRPLALAAKLLMEPGSKGRTTFGGAFGKDQLAPDLALDNPDSLAHDLYSGQRVELTTGRATVQFNSGAQVDLVAPASMEIAHNNAGFLQHGRLLATVPPSASGFVIDTHTLHIIDLGTEFGVAAHGNGKDEVHVFRGEVQVNRFGEAGDSMPPMKLLAGQSVTVNDTRSKLIEQAASPQAFADISASLLPDPSEAKTSNIPQTAKLLGLYTLDGDARDVSTNERHATVVSNVRFDAGYEGQAAYFTGVPDSFIDLPIDASAATHPELTMGAWVKLPQLPQGRMEILSTDDQFYDRVLTVDERRGQKSGDKLQFSAFAGPAVGVLCSNGPPPVANRWTFLAVTYRQPLGLAMLYVEDPSLGNGQGGLRSEMSGEAIIGPSHRTLRIGNHHSGIESFHGAIDNVFVFVGALSHKQLEAIRTGGTTAIRKLTNITGDNLKAWHN